MFDAVKSIWLKDKIMDRFVDVVILPEVFLRIYQVFFGVTKSEAEKYIFNAEESAIRSNSVSSDEQNLVSSF